MADKVMLKNPAFGMNLSSDMESAYRHSMPVPMLCLGTYLQEQGFDVKCVDGLTNFKYIDEIKRNLDNVDAVGLSMMTAQIPEALRISAMAKEKDIPVVWGGVHPTFFSEQTVKHPLVDYAILDEGEQTMTELLHGIKDTNTDFDKIKGIAFYDKNNSYHKTEKRPFLPIEKLPQINWWLLKDAALNCDCIPSHTSRGCPHRCAFCIDVVTQNTGRARPIEMALDDIEHDLKFFKARHIKFREENFFMNKKRVVGIIEGMIEKKLDVTWEANIRVNYFHQNYVNDEVLVKMKKSGATKCCFGAESGNDRVLKMIDKDQKREHILNAARACNKHKIQGQFSFMVGLPGEEKHEMYDTLSCIDQIFKINSEFEVLGPQPFRPYPGGKLYHDCIKSGWKEPESLDEWSEVMKHEIRYMSVQNLPWMKNKDVIEALESYVRFGAHSVKSGLNSSVKINKIAKLMYIALEKARWKAKFFEFPIEFKLAKYLIDKRVIM